MPSRNRSAKTCALANRSPNETAPLTDFSDIPHASRYPGLFLTLRQPLAGLEPLRRRPTVASTRPAKLQTWLPAVARATNGEHGGTEGERGPTAAAELLRGQKKEPPLPAARSFNREASNRVDRSHSMSRRWTFTVMIEKA